MRGIPATGLALIGALSFAPLAHAATLTFDLTTTNGGSDSADTRIVLTDIAGGVQFDVEVIDAINTTDIRVVYFDIIETEKPAAFTFSPGSVVTGSATDTNNAAAGNVSRPIAGTFDFAAIIGSNGSPGGERFDDFTFTMLATGLDVTDFLGQLFGIRGQSTGPIANGGGGGSSKEFGFAPSTVSTVPVPMPALLLLSGIAGLGYAARRRTA